MTAQNIAFFTPKRLFADVALPQIAPDASQHCHFRPDSAMVAAGRTQAAYLLERGRWGNMSPPLQEYWSRGCLRAHGLFSHFAWLPLWLHVPRKKKKLYLLKNRFQSSRPILANTSNCLRRAGRGILIRHAAFLGIEFGGTIALPDVLNDIAAAPQFKDRTLC